MKSIVLTGVLAAILGTCASSLAADLAAGTWEMNVEKSRPSAPTKRAVVTIRVEGNREETRTRIVRMDGQESTATVTFVRDGKEHAYNGSGGGYDSYVARDVSRYESITEFKKAGKLVRTARTTYSKDGKVRTVSAKGVDDRNRPYDILLVFDRQ